MNRIGEQILGMVRKVAPDVDPATVDPARPLVEQLDLDSIDYLNLLAAISTELSIQIPEADVPRLRSVDDLVEYVEERLRASRPHA